jgi:DNA-binding transcriptional regulator YiaG
VPFDDSEFRDKINPKALFSLVFDMVLKEALSNRKYEAQIKVRRFVWAARELMESMRDDAVREPGYLEELERLEEQVGLLAAKLKGVAGDSKSISELVSKHQMREKDTSSLGKKMLTEHSHYENIGGVKSPLKILLGRVALATKARGKKAALAKFLKVDPPRVSDWLRGRYKPTGEVTLRLLEWVAAEEAQQKTPGGAENAAKGKTRSIHSKDETNKSGPIKS